MKPAPVRVSLFRFSGTLLVLVRVKIWLDETVPIVTLPKLKVVGVRVTVGATPFPKRLTV